MASDTVLVRSSSRCLDHLPSVGHPETPSRQRAVIDALRHDPGRWRIDDDPLLPPDEDAVGVLRWLHDAAYLDRIAAASVAAPGSVDTVDCPTSSGTYGACLAAAGLALNSALDVANGRLERAFLVLRPPSHHAERDRARGFCFVNSVALAAEVLVRAWNAPILIVDFDAHHGNGTQSMFHSRGDVGYLSVHQYPFFPGTGAGEDIGEGHGLGATRNVPLAAGADDDVFATALEDALQDIGAILRPAAIVVSAGFDAHRDDPLAEMNLTENGFRRVTRAVVQASEMWAGGRVLSILEGGFHLKALAACARAHVEELAFDVSVQ